MQRTFFLKKRIIILALALLLTGVLVVRLKTYAEKLSFIPVLKGYTSADEGDFAVYYKTLKNSYDPELSWRPMLNSAQDYPFEIQGQSAFLIELDDGKVLYEKNPEEVRQIASLVKIMTAVVSLEHANLSDEVSISQTAANVGENSMGVVFGETYTVEELLYGLILVSGNDAAYALAEGIAPNIETFVDWMNFKAKELGLSNTYFADPSGLDDSTYSTSKDLALLARYALKNPTFRRIAKATEKELIADRHTYIYLENQTNLLTTYPGVQGIKTGYTENAGLCLVTYAVNNGKELVGVVLNSTDRKGDMILMLDHGFSSLGVNIEHNLLDQ